MNVASTSVSGQAPTSDSDAAFRTPNELAPYVAAKLTAEMQVLAERRAADAVHRAAEIQAKRRFWLAHHWPEHYSDRCFLVGSHPVCRRCSALYPLGFAVAFSAALGWPLWPSGWDPLVIWLLCLPASVAFVGEMLGWFRYIPRWQVGTTVLAGLAFGKALGYELVERWSPEFWGPIAVFGGVWFFASVFGHRRSATPTSL